MDYNVTDNNVHINRSCEIPKRDFQSSLLHIQGLYPDCKVFINRTLLSLKLEWACHNFLYQLHIARERVESVDLNWPLRWWVELLYHVGGFFVWIFVK